VTSTQELLLGVASQSLVLDSPRPLTSITSVAIYELDADDTGVAEVATNGSAAVDTATEATTAAAGSDQADPQALTVASTAGFVAGRRYQIAKAGVSESFELESIGSGSLRVRRPLLNAYASGATLSAPYRATIAMLDAWTADLSNLSANTNPNPRYRARVVAVAADTSETFIFYVNFDLVPLLVLPRVDPLDVENAYPGWLDALPTDDRATQGRYLIAEASRLLRADLFRHGVADRGLRNAEVHARLTIARTMWLTVESATIRGAANADQLAAAKGAYDRQIAALVESPVLAVDRDGGGAATSTTERSRPLWTR
jgi:hypothetical protein